MFDAVISIHNTAVPVDNKFLVMVLMFFFFFWLI